MSLAVLSTTAYVGWVTCLSWGTASASVSARGRTRWTVTSAASSGLAVWTSSDSVSSLARTSRWPPVVWRSADADRQAHLAVVVRLLDGGRARPDGVGRPPPRGSSPPTRPPRSRSRRRPPWRCRLGRGRRPRRRSPSGSRRSSRAPRPRPGLPSAARAWRPRRTGGNPACSLRRRLGRRSPGPGGAAWGRARRPGPRPPGTARGRSSGDRTGATPHPRV